MEKEVKEKEINEEQAGEQLKKGYQKAKEILTDDSKMEEFLRKLEKKLNEVPDIGDKLAKVPVMISLLKSYFKKEYQEIPYDSIIAIVSSLLYFLSPIDLIPDIILGVGYLDDAAVVAFCLKLVNKDIEKYMEWRDKK